MSSSEPSEEEKQRFMSRAIELSNEGPSKGYGTPFGAVIVKDGKIIGESYNTTIVDCDPTGHAEIAAIRIACKNLKSCYLSGCEIYSSCEPCPMCTSAMWYCRLDRIYYANPNEDIKHLWNEGSLLKHLENPIDQRVITREQVKSKSKEAYDVIVKWGLQS